MLRPAIQKALSGWLCKISVILIIGSIGCTKVHSSADHDADAKALVQVTEATKPEHLAVFGPEFEFTNRDIVTYKLPNGEAVPGHAINTLANTKYQMKFVKAVDQLCGKCMEPKKSWYKSRPQPTCDVCRIAILKPDPNIVQYAVTVKPKLKRDFKFYISLDPYVVEVQMDPLTVAEIRDLKPELNEFIFGAAKKAGLIPWSTDSQRPQYWGGGHVNMSWPQLSSAQGSVAAARVFLNFFVDYAMHPELSLGALACDARNAPPLALMQQVALPKLAQIVAETKEQLDADDPVSVTSIASRIEREIYLESPLFDAEQRAQPTFEAYAQKNQAINLVSLRSHVDPKRRRIEFRAFHAQQSIDEFLLEAQLLQARLNYIAKQSEFLPVAQKLPLPRLVKIRKDDEAIQIYPLADIKRVFRAYITETGLPFDPFKNLIRLKKDLR